MINLNSAIYTLIRECTSGLTGTTAVNTNIFPVEIPKGTIKPPVIVFERSSVPQHTKDGTNFHETTLVMYILTDSYADGIVIGNSIENYMDFKNFIVGSINIHDCRLNLIEENVSEVKNTQDLVFCQRLEFSLKDF
jgi:hypothetical protein